MNFSETDLKTFTLKKIKDLEIKQGFSSVGIRAASGLVKRGPNFFVIADDDLSLAVFQIEEDANIDFVPLVPGILPENKDERKKLKPDWESLTLVQFDQVEALLAIPSGSTANRRQGCLIELTATGSVVNSSPLKIDFSSLYQELSRTFSELNIEGACFQGNKLKLFQRGNGLKAQNAIIDLDAKGILSDILSHRPVQENWLLNIKDYTLGDLNGCRLDFTDACAIGDKIWFLAVAENSASTYEDGEYNGAILACLDNSGKILNRYKIECSQKPEGLWVESKEGQLHFYIVTDADDPSIYSLLYFGST